MSLSRRQFLKIISLGTLSTQGVMLSGCTHQKFYNPDQDILLGGGRFRKNGEIRHVLAVVNLLQKSNQQLDLDFLAHGIIIDPNNKKRLLTFEKEGARAAVVDLNHHSVTKNLTTADDRYFNGHGTFNKTGDRLFSTETSRDTHRGIISIRDGKTFDSLGEFPSFGENPHECQLINDGTTLVVSNAGSERSKNSQPCVTYIDMQSQQLVERITLTNKEWSPGHIRIAEDGSLIVASAARKSLEKTHRGGVSIRSPKHSMLSMTQPEMVINKLTGEALSIAIDERHNIAAITHPEANMITFWSIDKRELKKAMSVPSPRGITLSLNEKSFIVSYNADTSLILIDTKNLTADTESIMQPSFISGEHIYNWSRTLKEIMPAHVYT